MARGRRVERRGRQSGFELNLVIDWIGRLGPDPGGLAVWSLPSYAALDGIARDLDGVTEPVQHVRGALYATWAKRSRDL